MLDTICKENRLLYNIVKKQELYDFALAYQIQATVFFETTAQRLKGSICILITCYLKPTILASLYPGVIYGQNFEMLRPCMAFV